MSDQQRTSKASRGWLIFKLPHVKTRNCDMRFRKLGSARMSRRGETRRVLENDERETARFFPNIVIRISFVIRQSCFVIHFIVNFATS
jgi:hypothetical protein